MKKPVYCPRCRVNITQRSWRMVVPDDNSDTAAKAKRKTFKAGFLECGEYRYSSYDYETNIDLYTCECGCRFGIDEAGG